MEINKKEYENLINKDIEFLNSKIKDCIELDHIKLVLYNSIDLLYPNK